MCVYEQDEYAITVYIAGVSSPFMVWPSIDLRLIFIALSALFNFFIRGKHTLKIVEINGITSPAI